MQISILKNSICQKSDFWKIQNPIWKKNVFFQNKRSQFDQKAKLTALIPFSKIHIGTIQFRTKEIHIVKKGR